LSTARLSEELVPLNLDRLQSWIDQGRIDPKRPITIKELADSRCATNIKDGVKLLARGSTQVRSPLNIIVSRASASAIAAIEAVGGTITTRYYTKFAIQRILRGKTDPANSLLTPSHVPVVMVGEAGRKGGFLNRLPDPTSRKDIEYYRDPAHRGYLSYQVQEGQGPSLFHRPPKDIKEQPKKLARGKTSGAENRIW
jgi:large subunit ribosomal protein L15